MDLGHVSSLPGRSRRIRASWPRQFLAWLREHDRVAALAVPGFEAILARHGGDLVAFYGAVRELAALEAAEREARLKSSPG